MKRIKELDSVVLLIDIPAHKLEKGDVGTVVKILDRNTVEVEFINENGITTAMLPVSKKNIIRLNLKLIPA